MAKHESGTVRIIPADPTHLYHEVLYHEMFGHHAVRKSVETIHAPGRHRVESVPDNIATIFVTAQVNFNGPAFECVREHDGDMAIGFEYLPIPCCPPGFSCPDCA